MKGEFLSMKLSSQFCCLGFTSISVLISGCSTTSPLTDPTATFSTDVVQIQTATQTSTSNLMAQDLANQSLIMVKADRLTEVEFQPFIRPGDLEYRMLVLQGLVDYATALKNLSATDSSGDFTKIADTLKGDMNSTIKDIRSLPELPSQSKDVTGVCDAFFALGELIETAVLAHQRDVALKKALQAATRHVVTICDIFAGEMESPVDPIPKRIGHSVFYKQLEGTYNESLSDLNKQFLTAHVKDKADSDKAAKDAGSTYNPSVVDAFKTSLPLSSSYIALEQKKQYTLALCRALGQAFEKVKEAQEALQYQAETGKSSQAAFDALHSQLQVISLLSDQIKSPGGK